MRLGVQIYKDGNNYSFETTTDGTKYLEASGIEQPGKELVAYAEVICDDSQHGKQQACHALQSLMATLDEKLNPSDQG